MNLNLEAVKVSHMAGVVNIRLGPGKWGLHLEESAGGAAGLVRVAAGFEPPLQGTVTTVRGAPVRLGCPYDQRVTFVPAGGGCGLVPHQTVEDNIRYWRPADLPQGLSYQYDVRLGELANGLGLHHLLGRRAGELTTPGQRYRVAVARAVLTWPAAVVVHVPPADAGPAERKAAELHSVVEVAARMRGLDPLPAVLFVTGSRELAGPLRERLEWEQRDGDGNEGEDADG